MAKGKGKGPMVRPDAERGDSDSSRSSSLPEDQEIGTDFLGDDEAGQSPSPSASDEQLPPTIFRGQRPASPLRPTTSQSVMRLSQGDRSTRMADRRPQPAKRKGGASSSRPPSKRPSFVRTPSPQPGLSPVVPDVQQQNLRSQRGQLSRVRSVNVDQAGRYPSADFFNRQAERSWESLQKRGIVAERRSTLKDDPRLPILSYFEAVGWGPLLRPAGYYYSKLVRLFYCNLKRKDTRSGVIAIQSWLRGESVRLTPDGLAASLHLHCEGTQWEFTNDQKKLANLTPRSEIMATICSREVANRQPKSRDLTPVARVLLNIINTNILPKGGHREAVPPGYAFVIYCLIKGIRLSLPHLMISFMVYCTMDSKTAHTCPYPASITAMLEKAGLDMKDLERSDIRSKVDSATLTRMGIKLPVDQREPLQVSTSQATATRTSAATSHRGEGEGHAEDTQGIGTADEATSRPPDLSRLREDVLAMKEQQAEMREQLTRIESSQVDMLHSLGMIYARINGRRQTGSATAFRGPPPAAYWASPGVPRQSPPPNVGRSRLTIVPLEGDDEEGIQPGDVAQPFGNNGGDSDVEIVHCSGDLAPTLGGDVAHGGSGGLPGEVVVGEVAHLRGEENLGDAARVGQDPVDHAAGGTEDHTTEWTDVLAAGGQDAIIDDPADIRIDVDCLLAGDFIEPNERERQP